MQLERKSRRRWPWIAGILVFAGGIVALPLLPKAPLPIDTTTCTLGAVEDTVTGSSVGTVEAEQTAIITAEVTGRVAAITIRQGDAAKDAIVMEIDPTDLKAEREQTVRDLKTWGLRADQAKLRVERTDAELKHVSIPEESEWRKESLTKDLAIAKKDLEIAEASVKTQEAALAQIDLRLKKTTITAPFAGTVTKLGVEVGEIVRPGSTLFTLQSGQPYLVRAPIDETDVGRLKLGLDAKVTFDAFRGKPFTGKLVEIKPAATGDQKNNRTVDVKVRVKDIPSTIVTGMSAHVEVILEKKTDVLRIATPHIREDHKTKSRFVYVVENGFARRRTIETGLWNWELTEVTGGVTDADLIITRVTDAARETMLVDGAKVQVGSGK